MGRIVLSAPPIYMLRFELLVLQNVIVLGNEVLKDIIKLKWGFKVSPIQYDWCLDKKRLGHRHAHHNDHVNTQVGDTDLQVKERVLRRNQPCQHFVWNSEKIHFSFLNPQSVPLCYGSSRKQYTYYQNILIDSCSILHKQQKNTPYF